MCRCYVLTLYMFVWVLCKCNVFKKFTAMFSRMLNVVTVLMYSTKSTIVELNRRLFLQVMVTTVYGLVIPL